MIKTVQASVSSLLSFNLRVLIGGGMLTTIVAVETVIAYSRYMM